MLTEGREGRKGGGGCYASIIIDLRGEKLNDTPDLSSYSRFSKFGKSVEET